jgi:hypothetical protein
LSELLKIKLRTYLENMRLDLEEERNWRLDLEEERNWEYNWDAEE